MLSKHPIFLPLARLLAGIVVSGKKLVCPGGPEEDGRHTFGTLFENYYTFVHEIWYIFEPYALVVPFGGHIAIAYIIFS